MKLLFLGLFILSFKMFLGQTQKSVVDVLVQHDKYSSVYAKLKMQDIIPQAHVAQEATLFVYDNKYAASFNNINTHQLFLNKKMGFAQFDEIIRNKNNGFDLSNAKLIKKSGKYFLDFGNKNIALIKPINFKANNGILYELVPMK